MMVVLLGGARSGKSRAAVAAAGSTKSPVVYIATAEASDDEMTERIRRHQAERPADWTLIEAPVDLREAVESVDPHDTVIIDCLALWVTNRLTDADEDILRAARLLAGHLRARPGATFVVTNEVGSGIVPNNALARRFRDVLGLVNQVVVGVADNSYLCAAGRLLELKHPAKINV